MWRGLDGPTFSCTCKYSSEDRGRKGRFFVQMKKRAGGPLDGPLWICASGGWCAEWAALTPKSGATCFRCSDAESFSKQLSARL